MGKRSPRDQEWKASWVRKLLEVCLKRDSAEDASLRVCGCAVFAEEPSASVDMLKAPHYPVSLGNCTEPCSFYALCVGPYFSDTWLKCSQKVALFPS